MIPPLTLTVGQRKEHILGKDHFAIQAAVDYVARLGGGTVKIGPGTYQLDASIHLQSNVRIEGCGEDTILLKNSSRRAQLMQDADWYHPELVLGEATGFELGFDIVLQGKDPFSNGQLCERYTITRREGNRIWLHRMTGKDFWPECDATAATLFPILCGEGVRNVEIRNVTLDGNRENNEEINGNYAGGVFLQGCEQIFIDSVTSQNYHGDGFSWQIVHDLTLTNCRSIQNTNLGIHPGSGSQRPVIRDNVVEGGQIGLFFCWGVTHGIAEGNRILGSDVGISIGHRDTDNTVRRNQVIEAKKVGLLFRDEKQEGRNAHRNRIEENLFVDCGPVEAGNALEIRAKTKAITLRGNSFKETRPGAQSKAVIIGPEAEDICLEGNTFTGFAKEVEDRRAGGKSKIEEAR